METKDFWIKGKFKITNNKQRFYTPSYPKCTYPTGAAMDMSFTCNNCNKPQQRPIPRFLYFFYLWFFNPFSFSIVHHLLILIFCRPKFFVQIEDDSGTLDAFVQDSYAEKLLGMTADELYQKLSTIIFPIICCYQYYFFCYTNAIIFRKSLALSLCYNYRKNAF